VCAIGFCGYGIQCGGMDMAVTQYGSQIWASGAVSKAGHGSVVATLNDVYLFFSLRVFSQARRQWLQSRSFDIAAVGNHAPVFKALDDPGGVSW